MEGSRRSRWRYRVHGAGRRSASQVGGCIHVALVEAVASGGIRLRARRLPADGRRGGRHGALCDQVGDVAGAADRLVGGRLARRQHADGGDRRAQAARPRCARVVCERRLDSRIQQLSPVPLGQPVQAAVRADGRADRCGHGVAASPRTRSRRGQRQRPRDPDDLDRRRGQPRILDVARARGAGRRPFGFPQPPGAGAGRLRRRPRPGRRRAQRPGRPPADRASPPAREPGRASTGLRARANRRPATVCHRDHSRRLGSGPRGVLYHRSDRVCVRVLRPVRRGR